MPALNLDSPIEYLKGIGPYKADLLKKELGIFTCWQLLQHYPFRYIDRTSVVKISALSPESGAVQVLVRITHIEEHGEKRSRRIVVTANDETGTIELVWFQQLKWIQQQLKPGAVYLIYGKPNLFNGSISITHPEYEEYKSGRQQKGDLRYQPVYATTEKLKKANLDSRGLQRIMESLVPWSLGQLRETLPAYLLEEFGLTPFQKAIADIHFPHSAPDLANALYRLKFDEFFFAQLKVLKAKYHIRQSNVGHVFQVVSHYFNSFYEERLPFPLTNAQKRVLREIRLDTRSGKQMNRLLQGDVGSGKTVVALMSMLLAADNDSQSCLMAPTEILAQQHFSGIMRLIGDLDIKIGLLTGSTPARERKHIHAELENGTMHILIGTHALLEDKVRFANLGIVIIDEQHRFGVEQRSKLWGKNSIPPHMLVMTATPIPRTLAMTLYGDLDVSVIDELPAGRKPIQTRHLFENSRLRLFGLMRQEISKGRQIYIVYPLIKESEKLDLLNLEDGIAHLSWEFPLPEYKISIVHGKMPPKDKDFEMQRFVKGETQIMVATTVIEVGVNVPNATVMIIENAERFGLSQLHQLRGRVGRGADQSYCILMSGNKLSREGKLRLETMVRTNDGFEIAETDLRLRGPGDLSGTQQSGILGLKLADLSKDQPILIQARNKLLEIFENDPELLSDQNKLLLGHLMSEEKRGITWEKIS